MAHVILFYWIKDMGGVEKTKKMVRAFGLNTVFGFFASYGPLMLIYVLFPKTPYVLNLGWSRLVTDAHSNVNLALPLKAAQESTLGLILFSWLIPVLCACLPVLAYAEECIFRHKRISWAAILPASIAFGFAHALVAGIPIRAGLELSWVGLFYALVYRRAYVASVGVEGAHLAHENALLTSSSYHLFNNTIVVGLFFIFTIYGFF